MALFIFGAGSTRGSSFVNPNEDPCLPPVDRDFFTQLQKVGNEKHQKLISEVMNDVIEVFGVNFDVTMETVFTTLEHTLKMLKVTGDNRAFKKAEVEKKKKRLEQAIAVVLEDSICEKDALGHSSRTPRPCSHHAQFVKEILKPKDSLISFNYDCVLDFALKEQGDEKWNPRYGYGFDLGGRGSLLEGDEFWNPTNPATKLETATLLKLHGSLHFDVAETAKKPKIKLKQRPYTKQQGDLHFTIIPPEWNKAYDEGVFSHLWKKAATAIFRAESIVFIGYSIPETDLHSTALFRTSLRTANLKSLVVVNPDPEARKRTRSVMSRGLKASTKVLSFDRLEHFVNASRNIWEK